MFPSLHSLLMSEFGRFGVTNQTHVKGEKRKFQMMPTWSISNGLIHQTVCRNILLYPMCCISAFCKKKNIGIFVVFVVVISPNVVET